MGGRRKGAGRPRTKTPAGAVCPDKAAKERFVRRLKAAGLHRVLTPLPEGLKSAGAAYRKRLDEIAEAAGEGVEGPVSDEEAAIIMTAFFFASFSDREKAGDAMRRAFKLQQAIAGGDEEAGLRETFPDRRLWAATPEGVDEDKAGAGVGAVSADQNSAAADSIRSSGGPDLAASSAELEEEDPGRGDLTFVSLGGSGRGGLNLSLRFARPPAQGDAWAAMKRKWLDGGSRENAFLWSTRFSGGRNVIADEGRLSEFIDDLRVLLGGGEIREDHFSDVFIDDVDKRGDFIAYARAASVREAA